MANKVVNGVVWSSLEKVISFLATTVISIILARLLSPSDYGIVALAIVFVEIFTNVISHGLGSALVQKKSPSDLDYSTIYIINISIAVVGYAIMFFAAPYIASFYEMPNLIAITRVLSLLIPFAAISSVQFCYLQKHMQFYKYCIVTLGCTTISGTAGIIAAYNGLEIWALVIYYVGRQFIQSIILICISGLRVKMRFSKQSAHELLPYGTKTMITTFVGDFEMNLRSLIVGKVFTSADLAFYNMGANYPKMIISNVSSAIGRVIFPYLANIQNEAAKFKNAMRKTISNNVYLITPVLVGFMAIAPQFFEFFYTDKWLAAVPFLQVLTIAFITRPYENVCNQAIMASGRSNIIMMDMIITKTFSIAMILIAVFVFHSVLFIAWGVALTTVLGVILFAFQVKKFFSYGFREQLSDVMPIYSLCAVMYFAVYFVGKIDLPIIVQMIIQIIVGFLIYWGGSVLFSMPAYSYLISNILKIKKKK